MHSFSTTISKLPPIYEALEDEFEKGEASYFTEPVLQHSNSYRPRGYCRQNTSQTACIVIGAFVLGIIFTLFIMVLNTLGTINTEATRLDFWKRNSVVPPNSIDLEQVRFELPVDLTQNGSEFTIAQPDNISFVGTAKKVDYAWERVMHRDIYSETPLHELE
ncbi:hypothetical protein F5B19DRAFT_468067 [Rostrohypoxylon terebratum]|nr:hypothetical protein F5B19DRAFT_468067 [Rostrohypoxylon terebratum]